MAGWVMLVFNQNLRVQWRLFGHKRSDSLPQIEMSVEVQDKNVSMRRIDQSEPVRLVWTLKNQPSRTVESSQPQNISDAIMQMRIKLNAIAHWRQKCHGINVIENIPTWCSRSRVEDNSNVWRVMFKPTKMIGGAQSVLLTNVLVRMRLFPYSVFQLSHFSEIERTRLLCWLWGRFMRSKRRPRAWLE